MQSPFVLSPAHVLDRVPDGLSRCDKLREEPGRIVTDESVVSGDYGRALQSPFTSVHVS